MGVESFLQYMRDLYGKVNSSVLHATSSGSNSQQIAFMRQLQKDLKVEVASRLPLSDLKAVVFDIETTGFLPDKGDQIISIGAIKVQGCEILDDQFYTLVNAGVDIPDDITRLTGIQNEDIKDAPPLSDVLIGFFEFIQKDTLVAHHSAHEKNFMQSACWKQFKTPFKHRIVDTSFLFRIVEPKQKLHTLEDWCMYSDIPVRDRHHALGDAKLTAILWCEYLQKAQELGCRTLQDIYERLSRC
ncbi:MAG TPA: exonuclease domain-containing protein [Niallia sp.]|nr:exonuclease domain-containing protein [Niallia sp.]